MANVENNNKIIWYKTSEVEPPEKIKLWVCQVGFSSQDIKWGKHKKIRLDSWNSTSKTWNHNKDVKSYEYVYWTYPVYPEIKK